MSPKNHSIMSVSTLQELAIVHFIYTCSLGVWSVFLGLPRLIVECLKPIGGKVLEVLPSGRSVPHNQG